MDSLPCFWKSALWYLVSHRKAIFAWWRHQMETFSRYMPFVRGNHRSPGEFPAKRPVTRSFDVFFDLRLNKRLNKQWWGWWFETPSHPIWRHRNGLNTYDSNDSIMSPISTCQERWAVATYANIVTWGRCGSSNNKLTFDRIWIMKFGYQKWVTGRHTNI